MGFKQATTMIGNAANFEQVPATAGESYAVGEALVLSGGAATKCGATATPEFICQQQLSGAGAGDQLAVTRVSELQDLPGLLPGVEPRQQIQNCQPEVVSHHHDQDHDEEDGQLAGDAALIGQPAEGARDKEGQDGDHHPRDHRQHHPLELLQHLGDDLGPGPGGRQAHQHRKDQRGHHRHDGRDVQVEQQLRRLPQPLRRRLDGQAGDDGVAGPH